jgi:hypothetical protein
MKKIILSEKIWYIATAILLYLLSYLPVFYNYLNPPAGRTYLGYTSFPIDTLGNLTSSELGYMGKWVHDVSYAS